MLSEFYERSEGINMHMVELSRFLKHEIILNNDIESINIKPDHCTRTPHFYTLDIQSFEAAKKRSIPAVVTDHSIAPLHDTCFWKLLRLGFRYLDSASAIIAVSNVARKFISNFTSKDIVVIPNGVDIEKFKPIKNEKQSKALLYDVELIITGKDAHVIFIEISKGDLQKSENFGIRSRCQASRTLQLRCIFLILPLTMEPLQHNRNRISCLRYSSDYNKNQNSTGNNQKRWSNNKSNGIFRSC